MQTQDEKERFLESEPIAGANGRVPCGRLFLLVEGAGNVVDQAITVGMKTEQGQWLHNPQHVRDDHH
ncbi:MAG: hypothetical protein WBQ20_10830 [Methyloceanibacter sp.]